MNRLVAPVSNTRHAVVVYFFRKKREEAQSSVRELSAGLITYLDPRSHRNAGLQPLLHAHAIREEERRATRSERDPLRDKVREWAGGSRSQTHRRAAKGGFTQDDV